MGGGLRITGGGGERVGGEGVGNLSKSLRIERLGSVGSGPDWRQPLRLYRLTPASNPSPPSPKDFPTSSAASTCKGGRMAGLGSWDSPEAPRGGVGGLGVGALRGIKGSISFLKPPIKPPTHPHPPPSAPLLDPEVPRRNTPLPHPPPIPTPLSPPPTSPPVPLGASHPPPPPTSPPPSSLPHPPPRRYPPHSPSSYPYFPLPGPLS